MAEIPQLQGILPPVAEQYILQLYRDVHAQEAGLANIRKALLALKLPTFAQVRQELQANGSAPLNVQQLLGRLSQPQLSYVPSYAAVPPLSDPYAQDGALAIVNGRLFRFDLANPPGSYVAIAGFASGTQASLPTPSASESGTLFYVTDYRHLLLWNGSAWEWGPGDAGSGFIAAFIAAPNPATGWAVCDGAAVNVLNPTGTTSSVTTPDLRGDIFLKGVAVAGYTGTRQAATTATTSVNSGAGVLIGAGAANAAPNAHTHTQVAPSEVNGGLPLRIGLAWYMRV